MKKKYLKLFLPFFLYLAFLPLSAWADLRVSGWFFVEGTGFYDNPLFAFLFKHGERFGFFCGGCVLCSYFLSFFKPQGKRWRRQALAILLTLVIGAGLLTNTLLKGFWGRPRPKQVEIFGGKHAFRPVYRPFLQKKEDPQKSFPSGHAAMGFSFLAYCFAGRRLESRLLFYFGLVNCFIFGIGLTLGRIAQGGHFLSDVCFSFVLMWTVASLVDLITSGEEKKPPVSAACCGTLQEPHAASGA